MITKRRAPAGEPHNWAFKARFRRRAFGWKSQPAIIRIKQAAAEIKKVTKNFRRLYALATYLFLRVVVLMSFAA